MPIASDALPKIYETTALDNAVEIACECMLCDLPAGDLHGPVEWRLSLYFPGPYPYPGTSDMVLCDHCKTDWTEGNWSEPYNNFRVVRCVRI